MLQCAENERHVLAPSPPMQETGGPDEVYVARQPILTEKQKLFGYELLYRSGQGNAYDGTDPSEATSRVIANSYLTIGMERLTGDRLAFINFDRDMLVGGGLGLLPEKPLVVEVLEGTTPDQEVVAACRDLKQSGHLIALDDVVSDTGLESFTEVADIIKVDFQQATADAQEQLARRYGKLGIKMLAEKVETHADFKAALEMGYTLFQGYFFSRPRIVAARDVPAVRRNYVRVLQEISHPELDFARIEEVIKSDLQLVHRLLRYVNSAGFGLRGEIRSIIHAIALLGETELRKWVSLVVLCGLAHDKPPQLILNSVVRSRFCELVSTRAGLAHRSSELFLMGMFSLLDAVLDQPMERALSDIHLADDIRETLLGKHPATQGIKEVLDLARAYEEADWCAMDALSRSLGVPLGVLSDAYMVAVSLSDRILQD